MVREGIETEATVTAVARARLQPTGSRHDFSTRGGTQIIRFGYVNRSGTAHQGKSGYLPFELATAWKPSDRGAVRFDAENPAESVWMGRPPPPLTLARPRRRAHVRRLPVLTPHPSPFSPAR